MQDNTDNILKEALEANEIEEVDIPSQSSIEDVTQAVKELDLNGTAEEQYKQLSELFLNRKGQRKLSKLKGKDSFSSNFYKKIKL